MQCNRRMLAKQSLFRRVLRIAARTSLGVGVVTTGYFLVLRPYRQHAEHRHLQREVVEVWPEWRVVMYRALPLKWTSRVFSRIAHAEIPVRFRPILLRTFAWLTECDLSDAADTDLANYSSLGAFFNRKLRPETRPIDEDADLICPADGRVLAVGRVVNNEIEHVKGLNYTVTQFLADRDSHVSSSTPKNYPLHYCVIYLSPSNYHGFHSPLSWTVDFRRHIAGDLMSVRPFILHKVPDVLALNERVCLMGAWRYGFFSMTAVGATNVGNIRLQFDPELHTNSGLFEKEDNFIDDRHFTAAQPVIAERGQHLGEFRFGSTIVLIFSAPESFKFNVDTNAAVKYGQPLGNANRRRWGWTFGLW